MVWHIQYFMWMNWLGQNREADEEHADDCVEEGSRFGES